MAFEKIPQELKELKQWVLWKKSTRSNGKTTKIPVDAITFKNAQSDNKDTWTTYDVAYKAWDNNREVVSGLGFMFDTGYFGVDLDDCDESLQMEFINELQSYTEFSQSKTGIHIICKGKLPEGKRRKGNVEMYDSGRFFVMTGDAISNYDIVDGTKKIKKLHDKYLKTEEVELQHLESVAEITLSDNDVISRASSSKNGRNFENLFAGRFDGLYQSQSEADIALCNMLAFWTGRNSTQMDRIFRASGLYREKWDRKTGNSTYGNITIQTACKDCKTTYNPRYQEQEIETRVNAATGEVTFISKKNYGLNDTGNAKRMYDMYAENLKYNMENKKWLLWNGKHWQVDYRNQIKHMAERVSAEMSKEVYALPADTDEEKKKVKELLKNVNRTLNSSGKKAMIEELQHMHGIPAVNNDFDRQINLMNVENGVVDLKTGEILPHKRDLLCMKIANTTVNSQKPPKLWLKFLDDIFLGDKELIDFIQVALGYTLTGSIREQGIFIAHGDGSNGKSVFFDVISAAMGDYAMTAEVETLLAGKHRSGGANSDIARLKGARLVTVSESDDGAKFNEGMVKRMTGGEKIVARFLYGDEFEYTPEFKIWFATNHKPIIRGTDHGIWRRIIMIPFNAKFEKEKIDKQMTEKLLQELPQIMNWILQGCVKWYEQGLVIPKSVSEQVNEYKQEMNIINSFLTECSITGPGEKIKSQRMYNNYRIWAKYNNEYVMTNTKFGKELSKMYEKKRTADGVYYMGVSCLMDSTLYHE